MNSSEHHSSILCLQWFASIRKTLLIRIQKSLTLRKRYICGIGLLIVISIGLVFPVKAINAANPRCLNSKAYLNGFSVEMCTTDAVGISGVLGSDPAYISDFTDISLSSPEMMHINIFVIQNNEMPSGFSVEKPAEVTTAAQVMDEVERQYKILGVHSAQIPTQLSVNGNYVPGRAFTKTSANSFGVSDATLTSYWSTQQNGKLLIIEIGMPLYDVKDTEKDLRKFESINLNIEPASPKTSARAGNYDYDLKNALPLPSWWSGMCDVGHNPGSKPWPNSDNYRGVYSCLPNVPSGQLGFEVHFFSGAYPVYEWQCVELVKRYMYLAYGTWPYQASGNEVFTNYPGTTGTKLQMIKNKTKGYYPKAGDVISFDWNTDGHAAIVIESTVDSKGNGTYKTLNQNWNSTTPISSRTITKWDAVQAVGWLHKVSSQAPTPPTNVDATDNQVNQITVSWSPAANATRYEVWRYHTNAPSYATLIATNATSPFVDTSMPVTVYQNYWIRACNSYDCSFFSTHAVGNSINEPPTNTPTPTSTATFTNTSTRTRTVTATSTRTKTSTPPFRVYLPLLVKEIPISPVTPTPTRTPTRTATATFTPTSTPFTQLFYLHPALDPSYTGNLCTTGWLRINGWSSDYSYLTLNTNQVAESGYTATYSLTVQKTGTYRVSNWVANHPVITWSCPTKTIYGDSARTPFKVNHAGGQTTVYVDQEPVADDWATVGTYTFNAGTVYKIVIFDLNNEADWSTTISVGTLKVEYVP